MKKTIYLVVFTAIVSVLHAQSSIQGTDKQEKQQMSPGERGANATERMNTELGLTEDQRTKVLVINTEAAEKLEALKANKDNAGLNMREERKKTEDEKDSKLKAVLTDDQFRKYTQIKQEAEQKRREQWQQRQNE